MLQRPSVRGPAVEVYPLTLPEGGGGERPLGQQGEIVFDNEVGAPVADRAARVRQRFEDAVVKGPVEELSQDGTSRVVGSSSVCRWG